MPQDVAKTKAEDRDQAMQDIDEAMVLQKAELGDLYDRLRLASADLKTFRTAIVQARARVKALHKLQTEEISSLQARFDSLKE